MSALSGVRPSLQSMMPKLIDEDLYAVTALAGAAVVVAGSQLLLSR